MRNRGKKPPVGDDALSRAISTCTNVLRPLNVDEQMRVLAGLKAFVLEPPDSCYVPDVSDRVDVADGVGIGEGSRRAAQRPPR